MKKLTPIFLMICLFSTTINAQKNYQNLWDKVHKFEIDKLPKSALKIVDEIYEKATKDQNAPQIIKTLFYKSKFSLTLEEDAQLTIINQFKKHIEQSNFPTKNVLENVLANLYWQYFNENRWKFYNRTQTQEKVDENDFRTWDLNTLFSEIHTHFQASLLEDKKLQNINIFEYTDILQLTKDSKTYQPTLFDFLAHNSLDFYKTSETAITRPAYEFKIDTSSYISTGSSFSKKQITSQDSLSLQFHALKIYQQLISFHLYQKNLKAFALNDIDRLNFVNNHGSFPNKQDELLRTLELTKTQYQSDEISGLYAFEIAKIYHEQAGTYQAGKNEEHQFKNKEALAICNQITANYPKSLGARKCEALKNVISTKSLHILSEKNIPIQQFSKVLVSYKNLEELYFSVYKITETQIENLEGIYDAEKQYDFINRLPKIENWRTNLKSEGDYQQHSTEISVPKLPEGNFIIFATTEKNHSKKGTFSFASVQATDIAFILNYKETDNYQVVDRNTGAPLANAKVHFSNKTRSHYDKLINKHFVTNKNGEFTFVPENAYYPNVQAKITYKNQTATFGKFYINPKHKRAKDIDRVYTETFIFTDRSIYRPGQTIYFKGISIETVKNKSSVIANETVFVTLKDVDHQTLKELELTTNEFGSFASSFVIPNQGLTGQFVIETSIDLKSNYSYISVEEYKRPKFETKFNPVTETFKINDEILAKGKAQAYSGATVSGAKVTYRVHRKVEYPVWWYWYRPYFVSNPQEIIHGETVTDDNGNFSIAFNAIPDTSVNPKDLPVFRYEVTADVTDINGETRSATTEIKVGYHSLTATIELPDTIDKNKENTTVTIQTKNLNNEAVSSIGTVTIFQLEAPNRVLRQRPWNAPDYQTIPKNEFVTKFPHDAYTNEDNFLYWEKGTAVFTSNFNTGDTKQIVLPSLKKWDSGKYLIVAETKDKFGQKVEAKQFFTVQSLQDDVPANNQLFSVTTSKENYTPGENAIVTLSSNAKDINLVVLVEKANGNQEKHYVHLAKNSKKITIPVTSQDVGGISLQWYYVVHNSFEKGNLLVRVPYPSTDLEITTKTFRDKLQPGAKETWSFTVKGPKKDAVTAELLAGMYDASLDAFKPHQWQFSPIQKPILHTYNNAQAGISFGTATFSTRNLNSYNHLPEFPMLKADYNWFGFSLNNNRWIQQDYLRNLIFQRTEFENTVSGIVEEESGPLPGVTILIKGTTFGTETDFDGRFSLRVNKGDVLVFSFVGMKTLEKTVGDSGTISVLMENDDLLEEVSVVAYGTSFSGKVRGLNARKSAPTAMAMEADMVQEEAVLEEAEAPLSIKEKDTSTTSSSLSFDGVQVRKNLQETAFFYPQLTTDKEGNISFNFTVPEALTQWKLQLLAHTKELYAATKTLEAVTQKELMVTPNAPRFLRHGDLITLSSKISNLSDKNLTGEAQLVLINPLNGNEISLLDGSTKTQNFSVNSKGNTQVSWNLKIPETIDAVQYKILAKAGDFSDGEQNALPVLTNRMLVTETLPLWVRGNERKTFSLSKLKNNSSSTLKNHQLTLEVTSNPAWYAVQALPYLMEYPYECSEQTFARYYANTLASHIANANPRIQEVFKQWKSADALISNLEKNQELKSLIIQETPWLRDAQSETEQKKRIALLFDLNTLSNQQQNAIQKLKNLQMSNGGFPWFKGGYHPNPYITLHIASGFGHLKQLGVTNFDEQAHSITQKAVQFLDNEILDSYQELQKNARRIKEKDGVKKQTEFLSKNHLSTFIIQYLYMRSFYKDVQIPKKVTAAVEYYSKQTTSYWKDFGLYSQGLIALVNHRNGTSKTAFLILKSLRETSITSEELGMYWKANKPSWYWYEAPIETQALLIEAFAEIENDTQTVDNLKIWLLKNKQVSQWKTTKATTEAVYALLLQGSDWLSITDAVEVTIGNKTINPTENPEIKTEAGTGYFKTSWNGTDITPNMGTVTIESKSDVISWGGLYWQYFEDLDKITSAKTPLQLSKKIFKKVNSDTGKKLVEVTSSTELSVGDLLTIRIELRSDRDMEFVHMKDMRASGVEPLNVLSTYKWQDGLSYYESTKDAATNFFFDRLPKGVFVFEYDVRVNNAGNFSNGITTIQSMYAPEFSSHSNGVKLTVKE